MELRVDGRPFSLDGREYVRQVIRDYSSEIWIPKAAQMAFTVTALTRSIHNVVVRRWNGLYLLPVKTGSKTFVQGRIDPILDSNPQLAKKFAGVDNVLHKQTGDKINLYVRGTNIPRELQEIPVDFEVWDERDRMVDENLPDARHRMDGSEIRQLLVLSTPTVDGYGVYSEDGWDISDQHRWEVRCPGCNRFQVLNYEESALDYSNLKIGDDKFDCALECAFCKREISDLERRTMNSTGRWTMFKLDGRIRGYHISQFNSPTQPLYEIMSDYFAGQREIRRLRSFWNQNMGRSFTAAGDKITPELLDKLRTAGYRMGGIPASALSIGIDVGNAIHTTVYHEQKNRKMLWDLKIFRNWDDLDKYLESLPTWKGVIDAHPEKSKAYDLALKFHGRLFIGFSDDRPQAHEMANFGVLKNGEAGHVTIDKTMALDNYIQGMLKGTTIVPSDARELGERMPNKPYNGFYHQHLQMVRIEQEDAKGKIVGRWKKNRNLDHWHHSGMFATVATMIPARHYASASITSALQGGGIMG